MYDYRAAFSGFEFNYNSSHLMRFLQMAYPKISKTGRYNNGYTIILVATVVRVCTPATTVFASQQFLISLLMSYRGQCLPKLFSDNLKMKIN